MFYHLSAARGGLLNTFVMSVQDELTILFENIFKW